MENNVNRHTLLEFAEQQLETHISELNKHYEGRITASEDEKKQAFETHYNTFTAKLTEKSKELGDHENDKQTITEYQEKFKRALP